MRELKSNFAVINQSRKTIYLYENRPSSGLSDTLIENALLVFDNAKLLTITGKKVHFDFNFERTFVEDMKFKPEDKFIKFHYKTIKDLFKNHKRPCVNKYWVTLRDRTDFEAVMSIFYIVL